MITAYIDVYPAKGFIDHEDMHWAVVNAGLGLAYRHKINISLEFKNRTTKDYHIKVTGDDEIMYKFLSNPGRRLRGISAYLLKYWRDKYKPYLVGKRLLYYHVLEVENDNAM